ncbi:MAG TPA: hypothetical protein VFN57_10285 [Thermomicrobiaceae bacterium]|nr:hypothetical protein [Thermomicrobiaceae bacterium]
MTATDLLVVDAAIGTLALLVALLLGVAFRRRYHGRPGGVGDLAAGLLVGLVIFCLVIVIVVNVPHSR